MGQDAKYGHYKTMSQIEELKRIHDAETGTLKTKLVEQAAEIAYLKENLSLSFKDCNEVVRKLDKVQTENQALKSELEKHEENIATEFEATAYCDDQTNEMFMEYVDGVCDSLDGGTTYRVLILQKETE